MSSSANEPRTYSGELKGMAREARRRNSGRSRSALLIAAVIAFLWWKTQWPGLIAGLAVLFAGQIATSLFYEVQNRRIQSRFESDSEPKATEWFEFEQKSMQQGSILENGARFLGFILLAYGFWRASGNVPIAIGLGLLYPAVVYWGLTRVQNRRTARRLQEQKERLSTLRSTASGQ